MGLLVLKIKKIPVYQPHAAYLPYLFLRILYVYPITTPWYMRILLFTAIYLLSTSPLSAAVVTGQVFYLGLSNEWRRIKVITPDYTSMKRVFHYASVDENGQFRLQLSLPEPTEVMLSMGEHSQSLLLGPQDSLHISFDWNEWTDQGGRALRYTGDGAHRQRQLRELEQAFAKKFTSWEWNDLQQRSPTEIKALIRQRQQQEIAFWRSWGLTDPALQALPCPLLAPMCWLRHPLTRPSNKNLASLDCHIMR